MLFPLVHARYKNLQHRSKHTPIICAWRNRAKLNFLSDIHWLNDIEPLIDNLQQWERLKTAGKGNSTYCLQTWTHMSENAQNIAFFTRFVGAESAGLSINYILLLASLLRAIVLQYVISFLAFISYIDILYWLVVWNIFACTGNNHPNWRTHIFQRGRLKPPTSILYNCISWYT